MDALRHSLRLFSTPPHREPQEMEILQRFLAKYPVIPPAAFRVKRGPQLSSGQEPWPLVPFVSWAQWKGLWGSRFVWISGVKDLAWWLWMHLQFLTYKQRKLGNHSMAGTWTLWLNFSVLHPSFPLLMLFSISVPLYSSFRSEIWFVSLSYVIRIRWGNKH